MCGIAGTVSFSKTFSREDLNTLTNCMAHRGPDAKGYYYDEIVGLGHRRLSILDLSQDANQPMTSQCGRYVLVYNGEVYNYREIAANLDANTKFKTSCDTEVILESFAKNGPDFVQELNGMFAIAIYDMELKELFLFRDRIGIKPLYYYWDGQNFAFASELKALQSLKSIPKVINKEVIGTFLHLGYIPAPHSIYKNISKLSPGCSVKVTKAGIKFYKYWDLEKKISKNVISNERQALVTLTDLLISSVQYQLISDVPVGIFLSGGIDSSIIAAHAAKLSSLRISTFSIGLEESKYDESRYAREIARYLNTDHHEHILSSMDAFELIDKIFTAYDEPFADSSAIPTMFISEFTKKNGITVALTGEGGDELFFGYGAYKWARLLSNPFLGAGRNPLMSILNKMSSRYQRIGKLLNYPEKERIRSHIFSQEQYLFSEPEVNSLLIGENKSQNYNSFTQTPERKLNAMERQALFDLKYYLPGDLLNKVDRASMQYSLEARVPFLDHRLIEFALNISPDLKYRKGVYKYILKEILYQYIPAKYFDRPKKGFGIPLAKWLKTDLKYLIEDNLSKEVINRYEIVHYEQVEILKNEFFNGKEYLFNRLWVLIILHRWLGINY